MGFGFFSGLNAATELTASLFPSRSVSEGSTDNSVSTTNIKSLQTSKTDQHSKTGSTFLSINILSSQHIHNNMTSSLSSSAAYDNHEERQ